MPRLHAAPFDRVEILGRLRSVEQGSLTALERELLVCLHGISEDATDEGVRLAAAHYVGKFTA